jgi:hypothetical protein
MEFRRTMSADSLDGFQPVLDELEVSLEMMAPVR